MLFPILYLKRCGDSSLAGEQSTGRGLPPSVSLTTNSEQWEMEDAQEEDGRRGEEKGGLNFTLKAQNHHQLESQNSLRFT